MPSTVRCGSLSRLAFFTYGISLFSSDDALYDKMRDVSGSPLS